MNIKPILEMSAIFEQCRVLVNAHCSADTMSKHVGTSHRIHFLKTRFPFFFILHSHGECRYEKCLNHRDNSALSCCFVE